MDEFLQLARQLGHYAALDAGQNEVCTYFTVPTLEEARPLVSRATPEQRAARQRVFFHPALQLRRRLGQGLHDRGEAFVFADGNLTGQDRLPLRSHLPGHVKAISVPEKTVASGETWDVSVRGSIWGLDDMEELYVLVNAGTVRLERGARLAVRGNVFSFVCQRLVADGGQIAILPTPFLIDYGREPRRSRAGAPGRPGQNGAHGRSPRFQSTWLGCIPLDDIAPADLDGRPGQNGNAGEAGADGLNGGASKLAEVTLRQIAGSVTVFAQAGRGGDGTPGGEGGSGGNGGDGAAGRIFLDRVLPDGDGGAGGEGGPGGRGGHGGSGGISSNIFVNTRPEDESKVNCVSLPSPAGRGAEGGPGGKGGAGGRGAAPGPPGADGAQGPHGRDGRTRPAPWIFLNERHIEETHANQTGLLPACREARPLDRTPESGGDDPLHHHAA
jgi:hypothetical protein